MNIIHELSQCSLVQLRKLAKEANVRGKGGSRKILESELARFYIERSRAKYPCKHLLGKGSDGSVYTCKVGSKNAVIKLFHPSKTFSRITKEIELQEKAALAKLSVHLLDSDASAKYIVMPLLYTSLYDLYVRQGYVLKSNQMKDVKKLLRQYDAIGIFHGDPNPANFMYTKSGKLVLIDFGFAEYITDDLRIRYGNAPNYTRMLKGLVTYLESCKKG